MRKKIFLSLIFIIFAFVFPEKIIACNCQVQNAGQTTSIVAVGCDTSAGEIGVCSWPDTQPISQQNLNYVSSMICTCHAADSEENPCIPSGQGLPAGGQCCAGSVPFNTGYGYSMCKDKNLDPYHNCLTSGTPTEGQTCCAGSTKNDQGNCQLVTNTSNLDATCDSGTGISTAIGCVHVLSSEGTFLSEILTWAVGIGGGIAFVLILVAGFMIMTAQGNPERLKAGQELLTSALAGLVLLIFSVFILKFIGVDILGLDKFGFNN